MKIKVLLVVPGRETEVKRIPGNLKFIKSFIGDELYSIRLNENTMLIGNKNARIDDFNRIYGENILLGSFIIVSNKNNHLVSLNKKEFRKYSNMFKLKKHQKKVDKYKDEYLEEYYSSIRDLKRKNAEYNKYEVFGIAA
ncbi:MAG: hypothetical protein K6B70_05515 [Clostridia bacterium]|nr:hypothetical protein [Clostridia bacterium]